MTPAEQQQDLIVLAADLSMQVALQEVLRRHHSLGIREISFKVIQQPNYDTAFLQSGDLTLRSQSRNYRHALAVCDRHGCAKSGLPRERLEAMIEKRLENHWSNRAAAIVIDPELENWMWADSPHVAEALGWQGGMSALWAWLRNEGLLAEGQAKPANPQAALHKALRLKNKRKSSSLFKDLASKVSLHTCIDPAFLKLRSILQGWFPPSA